MNSKIHNELGALLAGLMTGSTEFIAITPKPGQSMEDAVAEHEAAHRKEYSGCAADHAIEQAKIKAKDDTVATAAAKAWLEKIRAQEAQNEAMKAEAPKRNPIGYMAFITRDGVSKPIPSSFNTDRDPVAKKIELLGAFGPLEMLTKIAEAIGQDAPVVEVKPVFL